MAVRLRAAVDALAAAGWNPRMRVAALDLGDGGGALPGEDALARAARVANETMARAVLPAVGGEATWGGRLAFAELPVRREAPPPGAMEVVVSEWAGSARPAAAAEAESEHAAWRPVEAARFAGFAADAMVHNAEDGSVGDETFAGRDEVREVARLFFAALAEGKDGAEPVCVLAGDVARGSLPDALDFDKAFVAVGRRRAVAAWLYMGRLWG